MRYETCDMGVETGLFRAGCARDKMGNEYEIY